MTDSWTNLRNVILTKESNARQELNQLQEQVRVKAVELATLSDMMRQIEKNAPSESEPDEVVSYAPAAPATYGRKGFN